MGKMVPARSTGIVLVFSLVIFLSSLLVMMWLGLDYWTIAWLAVVTGSLIGMMGGMILLILAMGVENQNDSSS